MTTERGQLDTLRRLNAALRRLQNLEEYLREVRNDLLRLALELRSDVHTEAKG